MTTYANLIPLDSDQAVKVAAYLINAEVKFQYCSDETRSPYHEFTVSEQDRNYLDDALNRALEV